MKVTIRKANPKPLPKLAKGEFLDPNLELERGCSHVCEVAFEEKEPKLFMGNSAEGALISALDHMRFCSTAYAAMLFPEKPVNEAKAAQLKREMAAADFKDVKKKKEKSDA